MNLVFSVANALLVSAAFASPSNTFQSRSSDVANDRQQARRLERRSVRQWLGLTPWGSAAQGPDSGFAPVPSVTESVIETIACSSLVPISISNAIDGGSECGTESESNSGSRTSDYSENWAGAVYKSAPSGATFTAVSATFVAPMPSPTSSTSGTYSAAIWVGIDGNSCSDILQTGIDITATLQSGSVLYSFKAWYECYPAPSGEWQDFSISAGDIIVASVMAKSATIGVICGESAEWIVEDYTSGETGELVQLADWGTVAFTDTTAETDQGNLSASGATIIEMRQSSGILTSSSISGSAVKISKL